MTCGTMAMSASEKPPQKNGRVARNPDPVDKPSPMVAKPDAKRRGDLLAAFVDHLLANGLSDVSLRTAATALGTSPQILLYYFGSKEALVSEAIATARNQATALLAREIARGKGEPTGSLALWRVWRWFTAKPRAKFMRLFFEVWGLALQNPKRFEAFLAAARDFHEIVVGAFDVAGFERAESQVMATLYLDTMRGLLLDFLLTGDRARTDAAVRVVDQNLQRDLRRAAKAAAATHARGCATSGRRSRARAAR
jgi:AcrR family transcriptional regulator